MFTNNRRRFLQTLLSASAVAPLSLGSLSRLALAQNIPRLKVVFAVIPDGFGVDAYAGYRNGLWFPSANSADTDTFELNEISRHLGVYAKKAVFLKSILISSGAGGHNGWKYVLRDSVGSKTSIDLLLGKVLIGNNPSARRIYSGPHSMVGAAWNISYENNVMIRPENNPYQLFNTLLGDIPMTGNSSAQAAFEDRSHLFDPINRHIQTLRSQLGATERAKLDTHLDAIEQVTIDLRSVVPPSAACEPAAAQPQQNMAINSASYREPVTRAHIDIISSALSCGTSRVATLQIGRSADPVVVRSVSPNRNPHDCSHRYGSVEEWRDSRAWYIHQVKYLLDRLASHPDPDVASDSLLDHTLVVLTSEMADGAPEHMQDVPVTLIGGASGLLNTNNNRGRFYNLKSIGERAHWKLGRAVDMQRVWSTIAQAAGTTVPYSGNITPIPNLFSNV